MFGLPGVCTSCTTKRKNEGEETKEVAQSQVKKPRISAPVKFCFVSWDDLRRQKFNPVGGASITDSWLNQVGPNKQNRRARIGRPSNWSDITTDFKFDKIPIVVGNQKKNHGDLKTVTLTHFLANLNTYTNLTVDGEFVLDRDTHLAVSPQTNLMESLDEENVQFIPVMHHYQFDNKEPSQLVIVASAGGTSVFLCDERLKELPFNDNGKAYNYSAETLTKFRKEMEGSGVTKTSGKMNAFEHYKNTLFVIMFELETTRKEKIYFDEYDDEMMPSCSNGIPENYAIRRCMRGPSKAKYEAAIVGRGDHRGHFDDRTLKIKRLATASGRVMIQRFKIGGEFGGDTWTKAMQAETQEWSDNILNSGDAVGSLIFSVDDRVTQVTTTEEEKATAIARVMKQAVAIEDAVQKATQILVF